MFRSKYGHPLQQYLQTLLLLFSWILKWNMKYFRGWNVPCSRGWPWCRSEGRRAQDSLCRRPQSSAKQALDLAWTLESSSSKFWCFFNVLDPCATTSGGMKCGFTLFLFLQLQQWLWSYAGYKPETIISLVFIIFFLIVWCPSFN